MANSGSVTGVSADDVVTDDNDDDDDRNQVEEEEDDDDDFCTPNQRSDDSLTSLLWLNRLRVDVVVAPNDVVTTGRKQRALVDDDDHDVATKTNKA